ncbi:DUF2797 domain-containing protein [Rhodococcus sp. 27YEA15]|uniref:DUF2797 domain-containing protein n=1 Tax=Rhodococcus sp. 27YEA15 TaxID=3156259 RepID=UPI003C7C2676
MTLLVRGIDWSDSATPKIRCVDDDTGATSYFTCGSTFRFFVHQSRGLRCLGRQDGSVRLPCDRDAQIVSGRQCERCRARDGFTTVHQAHLDGARIHPNVRAYLALPQWLYVDIFAGGRMKVGTAVDFRRHSRVAEQGAVSAFFLARSRDGVAVRELEARVSREFHLSQAVRTSRKIEALAARVDRGELRRALHDFVVSATADLAELSDGIDGVDIAGPAEEWSPPVCAEQVFDAAPLNVYPHAFVSGEHSLYVTGMAGSVAMVRTRLDPESPRFVADLSSLVGRTLTVGEFDSPGVAVQESLF